MIFKSQRKIDLDETRQDNWKENSCFCLYSFSADTADVNILVFGKVLKELTHVEWKKSADFSTCNFSWRISLSGTKLFSIFQRKNLMNFTSNVIGMEYDLWPFKPENYQKYHFGFVHWIFNWIQTIIFHFINYLKTKGLILLPGALLTLIDGYNFFFNFFHRNCSTFVPFTFCHHRIKKN